jgi:hypothetical protein
MYGLVVVLLTVALPLASVAIEAAAGAGPAWPGLVAKWFVFWGVGVRLLTAGVSQALRPAFTARAILGGAGGEKLARELGYANIAMGLIGVASLRYPGWTEPAGIAGALFLALAGITHAAASGRGTKENVAMATDFWVAAVVAAALVAGAL